MTIATDHGGPFRSARFAAFIGRHPELHPVRTRRARRGELIPDQTREAIVRPDTNSVRPR